MSASRQSSISMHELCLLHARIDRALRAAAISQLDDKKLTLMEWLALGVIATGPKQGLSISQIAEALDVTLPQVTALMIDLTKLKLAKQKVSLSDRRGRQVAITLRGKRTLSKLEKNITHAMQKWHQDIPSDDLQTYLINLGRLT